MIKIKHSLKTSSMKSSEIAISMLKWPYCSYLHALQVLENISTKIIFLIMGVDAASFVSAGIPLVRVDKSGSFVIGRNFRMNNGNRANLIGRQQKCIFIVGPNAELTIGNHVGLSSTAIVCRKKIVIEDHVLIGGNTVIYDTDFHPLNPADRISSPEKYSPLIQNKAVHIKKSAFIGAHSTILKGVTIGERATVGAGSVITRDIPADEIWGGNPATFIKKLQDGMAIKNCNDIGR